MSTDNSIGYVVGEFVGDVKVEWYFDIGSRRYFLRETVNCLNSFTSEVAKDEVPTKVIAAFDLLLKSDEVQ